MFEFAMRFLANPSNLWESDRLEDKQTVIRLVFADHLKYDRNEGFRTPKTSSVFKALAGFQAGKMVMAEREGFEPSIRFCRILTFQASAFDHSATAPHTLEMARLAGEIAAGKRGVLEYAPYL